jgi:hypothetical protein
MQITPEKRLALAITAIAALLATTDADPAAAAAAAMAIAKRSCSPPAGRPLLAIVALGERRVTIYDADGKILRAPVSTGRNGYETPPASTA